MRFACVYYVLILCIIKNNEAKSKSLCDDEPKSDFDDSHQRCKKFPRTFHKFQRTIGGKLHYCWIQDATPDQFDEIVERYKTDYLKQEPLAKYLGCYDSPACVEVNGLHMRKILQSNMSVVAMTVRDSKPILLGFNILGPAEKGNYLETDEPHLKKKLDLLRNVEQRKDVYKIFNVKKYLTSMGLLVYPDYRGINIGQEILAASAAVIKCNEFKVSVSSFTSKLSQKQAERLNFRVLVKVDYDEYKGTSMDMGNIKEASEFVKLMYKCG